MEERKPLFDINMGNYDGAQICELVGLYLLSKLAPLVGTKNTELYRDDGLIVIQQVNEMKLDRVRKILLHCSNLRKFQFPLTET